MHFIVQAAKLLEGLNHVKGVVQTRTAEPILSCVLLKAHNDSVEIVGTDLEISISDKISAEIKTSGSCVVSGHMLRDLIKNIPGNINIELSCSEDQARRLTVKVLGNDARSQNSDYKFPTMQVAQFPDVNVHYLSNKFTIEANVLYKLLDSVSFAMASGDPRYYLNGLYIHYTNDNLVSVATDGHRLAKSLIEAPEGAKDLAGVIIANKAVFETIRLLTDCKGSVEVSFSDTKISFKMGAIILTARLIDGNYPDYEVMIPKNNHKNMQIALNDLTSAVCRVATMSNQEDYAIKMHCGANKMLLQASNDNTTASYEGLEEVNINYDDCDVEIGFNSKYLLEVGRKIGGENVEFLFNSAETPVLIRQPRNDETLYLLMPMKV